MYQVNVFQKIDPFAGVKAFALFAKLLILHRFELTKRNPEH